MLITFIAIIIASILPIILLATTLALSSRSSNDRENFSPFECGFDPNNNARLPFSLRFFLLAVIFLVFDIEIVLLLPLPVSLASNLHTPSIFLAAIFLLILLLGLLHEWHEGSLHWTS